LQEFVYNNNLKIYRYRQKELCHNGVAKFDKTAEQTFTDSKHKGAWEAFTKAILVTGTPGVGKTTIAHKLASKLDANYLGVTELVKEQQLFTRVDEERDTLVADTEQVAEHLEKILANTTGTTVIEGHYAVDVVPKRHVNAVFVLRRDPRQLKAVLEARGYNTKKVWENITAEILDVCLCDALSVYGSDQVCEIDVSGKTVDAVVEEAILVLEKREKCRQGTVDWIKKLEAAGQIEEFLRKMG
jgi:adenylate kinase